MKRVVYSAAALVLLGSSGAAAQSAQCPSGALGSAAQITQDGCQQAIDLFQYMAPQLGSALAGGNATLGQGGSLGGLGHFAFGVRVNAVKGSLPQLDSLTPEFQGALSRPFPTKGVLVPFPTADLAVGIFGGIPLGVTNVGGIDLLGSATYVPKVDQGDFQVTPDNPLKVGYGVRLSALQESIVVPGLAVTYLKRNLPKLTLSALDNGSNALSVSNLDIQTTAWRVVASKSLILFGLAAGYGRDTYTSKAAAHATVSGVGSQQVDLAQEMTRNNAFVDLSMNFPVFKLVTEVGQVFGGDAPITMNSFQGVGIVDSRYYVSFGFRLGL
jgi:hypothetical protein